MKPTLTKSGSVLAGSGISGSGLRRREFLATAAAAACAQGLMPLDAFGGMLGNSRYSRYRGEDAHFFLHVFMFSGLDFHTLFDSRPLEMTAAKLIHDPMGKEPTLWEGTNGGKTWVTELTAPLAKYKDRFSVINGVVMLPDFNGHFENSNFTYTGNAFGGDALYPAVRSSAQHGTVLDSVANSAVSANVKNLSGSMVLSPDALAKVKEKLGASTSLTPTGNVFKYVVDSYARASRTGGFFSQGARAMGQGLLDSPAAIKRLQKLKSVGETPDADEKYLRTLCEMFKSGVTQSAVYHPMGGDGLDMHAPESTQAAKTVVGPLAVRLAKVFEILATTQFDDEESMLDRTTVLISTEFGRTMRQENVAIDKTGTDHNQFSNSMLIGGRGVKGGLVIGGSDFRTSSEKLSGAHKQVDSKFLNIVGAPYDPETGLPRANYLPESFKISDYLSFASVGNTIAELFGLPKDKRWIAGRGLSPSAPIKQLLI